MHELIRIPHDTDIFERPSFLLLKRVQHRKSLSTIEDISGIVTQLSTEIEDGHFRTLDFGSKLGPIRDVGSQSSQVALLSLAVNKSSTVARVTNSRWIQGE